MKNITILLISFISFGNISAQKYTKTYIKNANQVALEWLKHINNDNYEIAYEILSDEIKERYNKEGWIYAINELMTEFGDLNTRSVEDISFKSTVDGFEDGFYVFVKYSSDYTNTKNHIEFLILKQNDQAKWKILDYNYEFQSTEHNLSE